MQEVSPGPLWDLIPCTFTLTHSWVTAVLFLELLYQLPLFTSSSSELTGKKIICINWHELVLSSSGVSLHSIAGQCWISQPVFGAVPAPARVTRSLCPPALSFSASFRVTVPCRDPCPGGCQAVPGHGVTQSVPSDHRLCQGHCATSPGPLCHVPSAAACPQGQPSCSAAPHGTENPNSPALCPARALLLPLLLPTQGHKPRVPSQPQFHILSQDAHQ